MGKGLLSRAISKRRTTFGYSRGCSFKEGRPLPVRNHMFPPNPLVLRLVKIQQEKLSSDIVTTAKPQSPPSRLASQGGSKASLRACSTRIQSDERLDHLKGSDQHQTTHDSEFDIQERLSSDFGTPAKPHLPSRLRIAKQLRSSSKMRVHHKRKASESKKKKN